MQSYEEKLNETRSEWAAMSRILYPPKEDRGPFTDDKGDRIAVHATFEALAKARTELYFLSKRIEEVRERTSEMEEKLEKTMSRSIDSLSIYLVVAIRQIVSDIGIWFGIAFIATKWLPAWTLVVAWVGWWAFSWWRELQAWMSPEDRKATTK